MNDNDDTLIQWNPILWKNQVALNFSMMISFIPKSRIFHSPLSFWDFQQKCPQDLGYFLVAKCHEIIGVLPAFMSRAGAIWFDLAVVNRTFPETTGPIFSCHGQILQGFCVRWNHWNSGPVKFKSQFARWAMHVDLTCCYKCRNHNQAPLQS